MGDNVRKYLSLVRLSNNTVIVAVTSPGYVGGQGDECVVSLSTWGCIRSGYYSLSLEVLSTGVRRDFC